MKLYGIGLSPYVRKVRVVFQEKGIPYEAEDLVAIPKTPELMAMNPLGKIPILVDGDRTIPDSSVICAYLERLHPTPPLYPKDAGDYAQALFLEEYADTRMVDVMGGVVFERFIKPTFMQQEADEARVQTLLNEELPPVLAYLEGCMSAGATTLFEHFTVADAAVGASLASLASVNVPIDANAYPKMAAYSAALLARPSFVAAIGS